METRMINGILFRTMCRGGLKAILAEEKKVNGLNVFPVPDGDTGTNMKLTLEHGVNDSTDVESIGEFSKALARGMLLGARGNSGVILSQLFKGMSKYLKKLDEATVRDFALAIQEGYKTAYTAVEKPVEGTILTVARLGIDNIIDAVDDLSLEEFVALYIKSMKDVLKTTPDLLPVLKDAGVIDSGGAGLIVIYSGMENALLGTEGFDDSFLGNMKECKEENREAGYPVKIILKVRSQDFSMNDFKNGLEGLAEISALSIRNSIISLNGTSKIPGDVINYCCHFGTLFDASVTNPDADMSLVEKTKEKLPHKHIAYIAVAQGEGFKEQFKDFGCDIILDGGKTMNTSTEEFLDALEMLDADDIIILPNNKNVIMAALQAKDIFGSDHVHVLPTKSLVEGYFAFSMSDTMNPDIDAELQLSNMKSGIEGVHTFGVTMAVKDSSYNGIEITRGQYIAVLDGDIIYTSETKEDAVTEGLRKVPEIDDKEILILFSGKNLDSDEADSVLEVLSDEYPNAQSGIIDGDQYTYGVMIGIS